MWGWSVLWLLGVVFTYADCPVEKGVDFWGNDIGSHGASTMADCCALCDGHPSCSCVTWNWSWDKNCNMKTSDAGRRTNPSEWSAIVREGPNVTLPVEWLQRSNAGHLVYGPVGGHPQPNFGNGYVGSQVGDPGMYVAGVFSGRGSNSHRARIPSPVRVTLPGVTSVGRALDFQRGVILTAYRVSNSTVVQRTYAHQQLMHVVVTDFTLDRTDGSIVTFPLADTFTPTSPDINFQVTVKNSSVLCLSGTIKETEEVTSPNIVVCMCHGVAPNKISLVGSQVVSFITTIYTSLDSSSPQAAALDAWSRLHTQQGDKLYASHIEAMDKLWLPRIEIEGNLHLARVVNSSLWNILLSVRRGLLYSTSPGGLPNDCYHGHTFWDVEQFIWPNLLLWNPDVAADALQYRFLRKEAAAAKAHSAGQVGFKFPWESAVTGHEVDPMASNAMREIHISGDVAFAMWQYYQITHNTTWLEEVGQPILSGVAAYYANRATKTPTGYSMVDCMGVDESKDHVTDPIYVNAVAKLSLWNALKSSRVLNKVVPSNWSDVASGLPLLVDEQNQYHLQYEGSKGAGNGVGVVLLPYPLNLTQSPTLLLNDLVHYVKNWPGANAMAVWPYVVGYTTLNRPSTADTMLPDVYRNNVWGPFYVWSENQGGGGCPNFITGAGGFLQAIWAGYGGVRLSDDALHFINPRVPAQVTSLTFRRITYLGVPMGVRITANNVTFWAEDTAAGRRTLYIHQPTGIVSPLTQRPITVSSMGAFQISQKKSS